MTDEQLEQGIEAITAMLEQRAGSVPGDRAKVIEAVPEPVTAPRQTRRKRRKTDDKVGEDVGTEPEASNS